VDIAGIDNHNLNDLETFSAGVVTTTTGPEILILIQYAYLGQGKTIYSAAKIDHYKHQVNDKFKVLGGQQTIITIEGVIIPLSIRSGLPYLDILPAFNAKLDFLPHIILTSDYPWDPPILDYEYDASNHFFFSFHDPPEVFDSQIDVYGDYIIVQTLLTIQINLDFYDPF
jgi:hypothetical protein